MTTPFDRWLTTPPEDRWQAPEDEVDMPEMPEPCPVCDGVGTHGEGCSRLTDNPFARDASLVPDAGGYGVFAVMDDGDVLCRKCVVDPTNPVHDERNTFATNRWPGSDGWGLVAFDHTGNLEDYEVCAHCGGEIS